VTSPGACNPLVLASAMSSCTHSKSSRRKEQLYFPAYSPAGVPGPPGQRDTPGRPQIRSTGLEHRFGAQVRSTGWADCRQAVDKSVDNWPASVDSVWTREKQQVNDLSAPRRSHPHVEYLRRNSMAAALTRPDPARCHAGSAPRRRTPVQRYPASPASHAPQVPHRARVSWPSATGSM
jgi:hypothetical protein